MPEPEHNGFHSIIELLDRFLAKPLPEKWGQWKLDKDRRAIYYDGPLLSKTGRGCAEIC
jgi:hypothetical protein